jgi:hypothetical protein
MAHQKRNLSQANTLTRSRVVLALILLLSCAGLPLIWCESRLARPDRGPASVAPSPPLAAATFGLIVVRLDKQKDQRSTWAYTALVAIIAISVVKKTFRIPWTRFAYLLLGTAGVLMFESIRAGDEYERRVAVLIGEPAVSEAAYNVVNDLLWLQRAWINTAASVLLCFLTAVISNNVEYQTEDEQ